MSAPFDLSETDRLLSTTRAVRKRLDLKRPVEPSVVLDCIRLAQQAPTASNTQTWRWMVVTEPEKKRAIAELYRELGNTYIEAARQQVSAEDHQTRRVYESALFLLQRLEDVPVHVIPCVQARIAEGTNNAGAAAIYGSIFPAVWSFQLALRSRGLGSALTTLHLFKESETASLLGIPEGVSQVALLPVAYTVGTDFKPAGRPPAEEITFWNQWSDTRPPESP